MRCIFSWVNISDCHFGHGSTSYGHDQALVLERLATDVFSVVRDGLVPHPQVILVTGDISNSGMALRGDEYEQAIAWFTSLATGLGLGTADVLSVPGNHDVNRSIAAQDRVTFRLLDGLRRGAAIDDALGELDERARLASQLAGYRDFVAQLGSPCLGDDGFGIYWVHSRAVAGGFTIRIAGLNTALLCTGPDQGCLQLGLEQIRGVFLPAADPTTVTIALTHHPFDWLRDGSEAEAWTSAHADVHLQGHLHVQKASGTRGRRQARDSRDHCRCCPRRRRSCSNS